jgi:hypothetical protein
MALLARILPYYIVNELPDKSIISRDEAIAQLRERGLPVELIDHLRRAPEVLDSDEDPDTTVMLRRNLCCATGLGRRGCAMIGIIDAT